MNAEQIAAERYDNSWWRAPRPTGPQQDLAATRHRAELLDAVRGWRLPKRWEPTPLSLDELITEIEHLTRAGESAERIAERLGYRPDSLATRLAREDRRDLARPFWQAAKR
jgi:hypothetical protein